MEKKNTGWRGLIKIKISKVGNCCDSTQKIPTFRAKAFRQKMKRVLK